MAVLAIPPLVTAGEALLIALGVIGTGVAVHEGAKEVRKRVEAAERSKATPIARAEPATHAKSQCKCPPEHGAPFIRSTAGWSQTAIEYQARIGGLPLVPGGITEWLFAQPTFDGFDKSQCLLKEAKAKYDQFFDSFGRVKGFWKGEVDVSNQFIAQARVVQASPPARLRWYFMEPKSYSYFSMIFAATMLPGETVFHP